MNTGKLCRYDRFFTPSNVSKGLSILSWCGLGELRTAQRTMFGLLGSVQKSLLLPAQQRMVAEVDKMEQQSPSVMRNSHVDRTSARSSSTPFAKLRHIPVAALQLDQQHKGCRVEGVVCCKATRQVAVQVLMEDATNSPHAVKVSMYNLMPTSTPIKDVRRLLPEAPSLQSKSPITRVSWTAPPAFGLTTLLMLYF